jgi:hypothetical protein
LVAASLATREYSHQQILKRIFRKRPDNGRIEIFLVARSLDSTLSLSSGKWRGSCIRLSSGRFRSTIVDARNYTAAAAAESIIGAPASCVAKESQE